jgi:hypothetical protein
MRLTNDAAPHDARSDARVGTGVDRQGFDFLFPGAVRSTIAHPFQEMSGGASLAYEWEWKILLIAGHGGQFRIRRTQELTQN